MGTSSERVISHFKEQSIGCRDLGSPFTAALCEAIAEDVEAGGPCEALIGNWPGNPRKDALSMRFCGALHHGVLTGQADALAAHYPKSRGDWELAALWPEARAYLASNIDVVRDFIQSAPQTNETRRSIALLPGFLELSAKYGLPLNLLEIGASAGLNQNWDRFSYQTDTWSRAGDSSVLVSTDWHGPPPKHLDATPIVTARAACDLNPLDIHDANKVLRLRSYIWADQPERLARFDAAVALARASGVVVERADAGLWLKQKLASRPAGTLTVIYHSVFLQYPPRETIRDITETITSAGEAATDDAPLAWLCFEPEALFGGTKGSPVMWSRLQTWPTGDIHIFAHSDGHATQLKYLP